MDLLSSIFIGISCGWICSYINNKYMQKKIELWGKWHNERIDEIEKKLSKVNEIFYENMNLKHDLAIEKQLVKSSLTKEEYKIMTDEK